jgi:hypothetical protein
MPTLHDIESLTVEYSAERAKLLSRVEALHEAIEALKDDARLELRRLAVYVAAAEDDLREALEAAPDLFVKPRTQIWAGIKVGYTKQKGKVAFDDEAKVIKRIREKLPKDQAELLIRVREEVHKPGLYDLTTADLLRLGVRIEADTDAVVIKPAEAVSKAVAQLISEATSLQEAA